MTDAAFAGLRRASHAPQANTIQRTETKDDDPDETEDLSNSEEKEEYMTEDEHKAALAAAVTSAKAEAQDAGFKAALDRMASVQASEHYAGREKLAAKLLSNAKLDANEIIEALEAADVASAANAADPDQTDDSEDRANMRERLASNQPKTTASDGTDDLEAEDETLVSNMKARFGAAK